LANLQRHVGLADVDALVLSHEHPDHWLDVPVLRNALRYFLGAEGLPVYGTAGTLAMARAVIGDLEPTFVWHTVTGGSSVEIGDVRLRFSITDHPVETLAVRVDRGARSLLYSADTGPAWRGEHVAGDVDVFLCEATFTPEDATGQIHLTAAQAATLARTMGAARLVVTHVPPGVDGDRQRRLASADFGGPVDVAETGRTFAV